MTSIVVPPAKHRLFFTFHSSQCEPPGCRAVDLWRSPLVPVGAMDLDHCGRSEAVDNLPVHGMIIEV